MSRIGNLLVIGVFALACMVGTACNYDGVGAVVCEPGESSQGRECIDGYWVVTDPTDDLDMDVEPDLKDSDGDPDEVDMEVCVPETEDEFCVRLGKDCDLVTGLDNCDAERQDVDCGTCDGEEVCGEQTPNVCGCPCNIEGVCFPAGTVNSENSCEVCDPDLDPTGWSVRVGQACVIGDRCIVNAMCNAQAQCVGEPKDCSAEDSECATGECNSLTGDCHAVVDAGACSVNGICYNDGDTNPANECEACISADRQDVFSARMNGEICVGDGRSCTTSTCRSGVCTDVLQSDKCLIGGACFDNLETRSGSVCEACIVAESQTDWSDNDGARCDDGISCTGNGVCAGGSCQDGNVEMGCLIAQMCVQEGSFESPDMCDVCDPGADTTDWTRLAPGEDCEDDGLTCTENLCARDGKCEAVIEDDTCLIDGVCYQGGDLNPDGDGCQECDPEASQTDWTDLDGVTSDACNTMQCACEAGECRNPGGNRC